MRWIRRVGVFFALALFACFRAIAETDDAHLMCPSGERGCNGLCRTICTQTSDCTGSDRCLRIDDQAVCLPYASCTFLGSDTQCVGEECTYYTRGGQQKTQCTSTPGANPQDITSFSDPTFEPSVSYYLQDGCKGNARYETTPAVGDPACGMTQTVKRCMRSGTTCMLVDGTTKDFVAK